MTAPVGGMTLRLPRGWFQVSWDGLPDPAPAGSPVSVAVGALRELASTLGGTSSAAAAIYDVAGQLTVASVLLSRWSLPGSGPATSADLVELRGQLGDGLARYGGTASAHRLRSGPALRWQASYRSGALPTAVTASYLVAPREVAAAVLVSFSAFGEHGAVVAGRFDQLADGLTVDRPDEGDR